MTLKAVTWCFKELTLQSLNQGAIIVMYAWKLEVEMRPANCPLHLCIAFGISPRLIVVHRILSNSYLHNHPYFGDVAVVFLLPNFRTTFQLRVHNRDQIPNLFVK